MLRKLRSLGKFAQLDCTDCARRSRRRRKKSSPRYTNGGKNNNGVFSIGLFANFNFPPQLGTLARLKFREDEVSSRTVEDWRLSKFPNRELRTSLSSTINVVGFELKGN